MFCEMRDRNELCCNLATHGVGYHNDEISYEIIPCCLSHAEQFKVQCDKHDARKVSRLEADFFGGHNWKHEAVIFELEPVRQGCMVIDVIRGLILRPEMITFCGMIFLPEDPSERD